jgi:hypothetical protein
MDDWRCPVSALSKHSWQQQQQQKRMDYWKNKAKQKKSLWIEKAVAKMSLADLLIKLAIKKWILEIVST